MNGLCSCSQAVGLNPALSTCHRGSTQPRRPNKERSEGEIGLPATPRCGISYLRTSQPVGRSVHVCHSSFPEPFRFDASVRNDAAVNKRCSVTIRMASCLFELAISPRVTMVCFPFSKPWCYYLGLVQVANAGTDAAGSFHPLYEPQVANGVDYRSLGLIGRFRYSPLRIRCLFPA